MNRVLLFNSSARVDCFVKCSSLLINHRDMARRANMIDENSVTTNVLICCSISTYNTLRILPFTVLWDFSIFMRDDIKSMEEKQKVCPLSPFTFQDTYNTAEKVKRADQNEFPAFCFISKLNVKCA